MNYQELAAKIYDMDKAYGKAEATFSVSRPAKDDPMERQLGFVYYDIETGPRITWNGAGKTERLADPVVPYLLSELDEAEIALIRIEEGGHRTVDTVKYTRERIRILVERVEKEAAKARGADGDINLDNPPVKHITREGDGRPAPPIEKPGDILQDAAAALARVEQGPVVLQRIEKCADTAELAAELKYAKTRIDNAVVGARAGYAKMKAEFAEARNTAQNDPGSELSEQINWENVGKLQYRRRERIATAYELQHLATRAERKAS